MLPISQAQQRFDDAIKHFETEMQHIRAGRPTPEMFSGIKVEAYGSQTTLESVGNINIVDASLVTIQPWDKTLVNEVAKAIQTSNLGLNPQIDNGLIRLPIPPINQEKRQELVKNVKEIAEQSRISVRVIRKDVMSWLDDQKKQGNMPEDQQKSEEKKLQDMVDKTNQKIEELLKSKEEALMTV